MSSVFRKIDEDTFYSNDGCVGSFALVSIMTAAMNLRMSNYITRYTAGYPISYNAMEIDDDLLIVGSYASRGVMVFRIESDGSLTFLEDFRYPYNPYSSGAYYITAFAVDKARGVAYCNHYNYTYTGRIDYSAYKNGGSGPLVDLGAIGATEGLNYMRAGYAYCNGYAIWGDWLYVAPYSSRNGLTRVNTQTLQEELLTCQNIRNNGYMGFFRKDEANNRLYVGWFYNGGWWVVDDPGSASPTVRNLGLYSISGSDDARTECFVVDKDNPNHVWIGSNYYIHKVDITPIYSGQYVTELYQSPHLISGSTEIYLRMGYTRMSAPHDVHKSDLILIGADRGYDTMWGWWDQENEHPVSPSPWSYKVDEGADDPVRMSYSGEPILYDTTSGTKVWISSCYGYDSGIYSHPYNAFQLPETSGFELGPFQFDDGRTVEEIRMASMIPVIPTDCSVDVWYSNDNGITWEGGVLEGHVFFNTGNTVKVKYQLNGTPIKCPYFKSPQGFFIELIHDDVPREKTLRTFYRIRGT